MLYKIRYHTDVLKDLDVMPDEGVWGVIKIIQGLKSDVFPSRSQCKLKFFPKYNTYRIIVAGCRVIYMVDHEEKLITVIGIKPMRDYLGGIFPKPYWWSMEEQEPAE